ncbi:helix-turn-helix domain-containing protein [Virgibacillus oceani]
MKLLESDMTAYRISKETGVSESQLSRMKNGEIEVGRITLDNAIKLNNLWEELKMNFLVTGYKVETFENVAGMEMQEENLISEAKYNTATQAEEAAKELYEKGADHIEIVHLGGKDHAVRYWNPREGVAATGVNWTKEFEAGYQV